MRYWSTGNTVRFSNFLPSSCSKTAGKFRIRLEALQNMHPMFSIAVKAAHSANRAAETTTIETLLHAYPKRTILAEDATRKTQPNLTPARLWLK
jgi:hypothetical protein